MSDARSTSRYAALLLGGSVLVVGALIASGVNSAKSSVSAQATDAPAAAGADQAAFQEWAGSGDEADGKLIGEIQRNGKTVELRQLPEGAQVDPDDSDLAPDSVMTDQNEPSR
jgi:hypothetical protein